MPTTITMSIQSDNTSQYAHIVLVAKMLIAQPDNIEMKTLTTPPKGNKDSIETKPVTGSAKGKPNVVVAQRDSIETKTVEGKRNAVIAQRDNVETKTSSPEGQGNTRKVDCPPCGFIFTLHFSASNTSNPDSQASNKRKGKWSYFWKILSVLCLAPT